jgi:putative endonuclease
MSELRRQLRAASDAAATIAGEVSAVLDARAPPAMSAASAFSIYLVRCADGSIYTGIATDVLRRLREHESGRKGSRYLRGKGPLQLLFQCEVGDRSTAQRIENRVRRLPPTDKGDPVSVNKAIERLLAELRDQ